MINKKKEKSPSPEKAQKTSPIQKGSPGPAPGLSPFEIEAGTKISPDQTEKGLEDRSGTISQASEVRINPRVAGQLLNLPFKCLHIAYPVAQPLSPDELEVMAEPFSDFLIENGWEKIGKSWVVLAGHLFVAGYSRARAIADFKKAQKNEAAPKADPDNRETRPREDVAGPSDHP